MGDFDFSRADFTESSQVVEQDIENDDGYSDGQKNGGKKGSGEELPNSSSEPLLFTEDYIDAYKPRVVNREWHLSETDLEWITTGCYILGTGGGGSPYQHMLRLREMMRAGATVRIISPWDLRDDDLVACGGGKGSPQVSIEKPYGEE